jgi:hypothetical protein
MAVRKEPCDSGLDIGDSAKKLPHETEQGRLYVVVIVVPQVFAVVISRHGENRPMIKLIGLIELRVILADLAIEMNAVAGDVEEVGRGAVIAGLVQIGGHALGDDSLGLGIRDAAHVAIEMENQAFVVDDLLVVRRGQDVLQVQAIRRCTGRIGQVAEMGVAGRLAVDGMTRGGGTRAPEYMTI